jgi:hypothetical protein
VLAGTGDTVPGENRPRLGTAAGGLIPSQATQIPVAATTPTAPTQTAPQPTPTAPAARTVVQAWTYPVAQGDTYEGLAKAFGIPEAALRRANNDVVLEVGRVIVVPMPLDTTATATANNTELIREIRGGNIAILEVLEALRAQQQQAQQALAQTERLGDQSFRGVSAAEYAACPTCQAARQPTYYAPEPSYAQPYQQPYCQPSYGYQRPYYQDYGSYGGGYGGGNSISINLSQSQQQQQQGYYPQPCPTPTPQPQPYDPCPPGSPRNRQLGWQPGDGQWWNNGTGRNAGAVAASLTPYSSGDYLAAASRSSSSSPSVSALSPGGTPSPTRLNGGLRALNNGGTGAAPTARGGGYDYRAALASRTPAASRSTATANKPASRVQTYKPATKPSTARATPSRAAPSHATSSRQTMSRATPSRTTMSRAPSRTPSRQTMRTPSRTPSRQTMRTPSRATVSRAPSRAPTMSRGSSSGGMMRRR